ncbi:MCE family protein [Mumia zhuanghuii]|uniref:MCE family protein n=1 Tax=Mumia zhuanghuii TaxID=2585211 RepID=A0A5C4N241_9ACTN|nr:MCE family protein [Mumia zhuanghuii]TNC52279.1 MCE family protein [Mumia zhuanghuii]
MISTLIKSIVFTVVTVLATLALAGTIRNSTSGESTVYTALFSDATSLNRGDDVRMAGVKVGTVESIEVADQSVAKVTFTISDAVTLTTGATAQLRFRNLVGQRYISLVPTETTGPPLPEGHTFTVSETRPALDLTLLFNGFQPLFKMLNPDDVNQLSSEIIAVFQGEGATVEGLLSSTASLTSTLAERDEVIGQLVTNLNEVLSVVNDRTDQLDTTLVTLQKLVSGLAADRVAIGESIAGIGALTTSVSGLLEETRPPLKGSIAALEDVSTVLADNEEVVDTFLQRLPTKLDKIGRLVSYGSWFNFYVCSIEGRIPMPEGYMGDLGVKPVAGRCR